MATFNLKEYTDKYKADNPSTTDAQLQQVAYDKARQLNLTTEQVAVQYGTTPDFINNLYSTRGWEPLQNSSMSIDQATRVANMTGNGSSRQWENIQSGLSAAPSTPTTPGVTFGPGGNTPAPTTPTTPTTPPPTTSGPAPTNPPATGTGSGSGGSSSSSPPATPAPTPSSTPTPTNPQTTPFPTQGAVGTNMYGVSNTITYEQMKEDGFVSNPEILAYRNHLASQHPDWGDERLDAEMRQVMQQNISEQGPITRDYAVPKFGTSNYDWIPESGNVADGEFDFVSYANILKGTNTSPDEIAHSLSNIIAAQGIPLEDVDRQFGWPTGALRTWFEQSGINTSGEVRGPESIGNNMMNQDIAQTGANWAPGAQGSINTAGNTIMGNPQGTEVRQQMYENVSNPNIAEDAVQRYTATIKGDIAGGSQFLDSGDPMMYVQQVEQARAAQAALAQANIPEGMDPSTYAATEIFGMAPEAGAATLNPADLVEAEAATAPLTEKAMMSYQLSTLLNDLEGGKTPSWAKPAVDQVEAMLASRGLERSNIGRDALFNAIVQAAMPMAQQQAQAEYGAWSQNLSNEQQAAMLNAQAGVNVQMANLNNEQYALITSNQNKMTALLNDQAASNAAKQFNATSEAQTNQFMVQMATQVGMFNATQANAMAQNNAQREDAMSQFNTQVEVQRQQFNAQMASVLEQSNVTWRRQLNQIDTAGINAVNQANAINAFNLSNQALTNLWQDLRDGASWTFQAGESGREREVRMAIAALSNEAEKDRLSSEQWQAVGSWLNTTFFS